MALTSLGNPALVQTLGAETWTSWSDTGRSACGHSLVPTPTPPGDYVAIMQHDTTSRPGASVNFRVGYRLL